MKKYGNANPWRFCQDANDYLGIGALVEGKVLCIHGGLSPEVNTLDQIRAIDRIMEIPEKGPFTDLMWSDPDDIEGFQVSPRGAGFFFGLNPTTDFNQNNGLNLIARAHQLCNEGYKFWFEDKLVTVWSAPNYCYRCGNEASILQIKEDLSHNIVMFNKSEKQLEESEMTLKKISPYFL